MKFLFKHARTTQKHSIRTFVVWNGLSLRSDGATAINRPWSMQNQATVDQLSIHILQHVKNNNKKLTTHTNTTATYVRDELELRRRLKQCLSASCTRKKRASVYRCTNGWKCLQKKCFNVREKDIFHYPRIIERVRRNSSTVTYHDNKYFFFETIEFNESAEAKQATRASTQNSDIKNFLDCIIFLIFFTR